MKRLIVLIAMLLGVMSGITANEMTQEKRVAILPFMVKGNFDRLYAEVALDNFTTELIKGDIYQVVERAQLDKAMKELQFQSGADFDESSAVEVGKLAGAEIVIIGIVTALKRSQIVVNIRGISVKTGIADFAEKEFIHSKKQLFTAVEKIAKKLSGSSRTNSWNQSKQSEAIDFSIGEEYGNVPLSHSDKKFIAKYFQEKWGIDPKDTYNVHDMYKRYMTAGIAMATVGGVCTLTGFIFIMTGVACINYKTTISEKRYYYGSDDYYYEDKTIWPYEDTGYPLLFAGIPILFAVGLPLIVMSSWPFVIADKTKSIYRKVTGQRSFTPRISSTGGFNGEDRKLEIAFGCQF